jgi:REP element-mobilizing transposase RayT
MAKGHNNSFIFNDLLAKTHFIDLLPALIKRHLLTVHAWCIMDNHYHLIIQVANSPLSRFMKELNGSYGSWYRRTYGGKGSVFAGRFKSTIIENEHYLFESIRYLFMNPVRAGLVSSPEHYPWSSLHNLLMNKSDFADNQLLLSGFDTTDQLLQWVNQKTEIPAVNFNRWGESLGSQSFRFHSLQKVNRRKTTPQNKQESPPVSRIRQKQNAVGKIIEKFLLRNKITLKELTAKTQMGSTFRGKLIQQLRDEHQMKISEIQKLKPFKHLSQSAISNAYHRFINNNKLS